MRVGNMKDEEAMELGRRAVACKAFKWMPGMLVGMVLNTNHPEMIRSDRLIESTKHGADGLLYSIHGVRGRVAWPDFRDPATMGCLLHAVREAWGDVTISICIEKDGSASVGRDIGLTVAVARTLAETLIAALEAAQ
jgi:hypothetical protein